MPGAPSVSIYHIINKKKSQMKNEEYYEESFWKENGWASCFECDEIFEDLEELFEHQKLHLKEEIKLTS